MSISFNVPSIPHVQSVVFSIRVVLGSNLRDLHIGIRQWWWLEYILISPAQHQLHHSIAKKHHDKNFGAALAIWDWIFGSLHHSEEFDTLKLGIEKNQMEDSHDLKTLYLNPFIEIKHYFNKRFNKLKNKIFKIKITRRLFNAN